MDAQTSQNYGSVGAAVSVIGMTTLTGSAETWYLEAEDSFAAMEQVDQALPRLNGPQAPSRSWIAIYRQDLSYRPREAVANLPKARYFQISLYRIQAGAEGELADMLKARKATLDSVNMDRPDLTYQVISGATSGTYLRLLPLPTLKTFDDGLATIAPTARPAAKEVSKIDAGGDINRESLLLRVEPNLSHVSDDFAGADRPFWKPQGN